MKTLLWKTLSLALVVIALAAFLASCSDGETPPASQTPAADSPSATDPDNPQTPDPDEPIASAKDTLIFTIDTDPGNDINTITTSDRWGLTVERVLYSPLINYYGPDDITFELAEGFSVSDDGKVVTFNLRQGVLWSDGAPFTADDVVFTFQKIVETPYANGYDTLIYGDEKVEAIKIDDHTVEIHFPIALGNALEVAANERFIMPKHIYEGDETLDNNPKNATPVGTGPYTLVEYSTGQHLRFAANENYFGGKPKIDTLIFQIITDANAAALALKTGELNTLVIQPVNASEYGPDSGVTVYSYPEDRVGYLSFNLGSPRVADINYRKAVFFALDRTELNTGVYLSEDYYVDAVSFLPYSSSFFTGDLERYDFNLDQSQEYLDLVSDAQTLRIAHSAGNVTTETQAIIIQQQLRTAGITAEVVAIESNSLFDKLENGTDEFELFLNGYIMGIDPSNYAALFVSDGPYNYGRVADEELDALFAAGSVEVDPAKRVEIYQDAQRRLADLAVQFPIVTNLRLIAISSDLAGIEAARFIPIYTFENFGRLYFN